jgi:hypothetical protein
MIALPLDIKKAIIALIASCVFSFTGFYFEGRQNNEFIFDDSWIFWIHIGWIAIIIWFITDILRRKNINTTILIVTIIMSAFFAWEYLEYGYSSAQIFRFLELSLFFIAYRLLRTEKSKAWYAA